MAHELLTLVVRQPHAKAIVHDCAGDLVLDIEQPGGVTIVGAGPELPAGGDVHEPGCDSQPRQLALERTREDRLHAELAAGCLRITLRPLEVEDDSQRSDTKRAQLRDLLDQAFGDAVTQVLEVLVTGGVHQRQHRQRANSRPT